MWSKQASSIPSVRELSGFADELGGGTASAQRLQALGVKFVVGGAEDSCREPKSRGQDEKLSCVREIGVEE